MPQTKSSKDSHGKKTAVATDLPQRFRSEAERLHECQASLQFQFRFLFLFPAAGTHRWLIMQPKLETKPLSHLRIYTRPYICIRQIRATLSFSLPGLLLQKLLFVWKVPDFPAHWSTLSTRHCAFNQPWPVRRFLDDSSTIVAAIVPESLSAMAVIQSCGPFVLPSYLNYFISTWHARPSAPDHQSARPFPGLPSFCSVWYTSSGLKIRPGSFVMRAQWRYLKLKAADTRLRSPYLRLWPPACHILVTRIIFSDSHLF